MPRGYLQVASGLNLIHPHFSCQAHTKLFSTDCAGQIEGNSFFSGTQFSQESTQAWEQLWKMGILEWSWIKDDSTPCFQYIAPEHSCPWDLRLPELHSSQESSTCWAPSWYQTSRGHGEGLCHPCLPNPHKLTEDALTARKCLLINQPFFVFPPKTFASFPLQEPKICSGSSWGI